MGVSGSRPIPEIQGVFSTAAGSSGNYAALFCGDGWSDTNKRRKKREKKTWEKMGAVRDSGGAGVWPTGFREKLPGASGGRCPGTCV